LSKIIARKLNIEDSKKDCAKNSDISQESEKSETTIIPKSMKSEKRLARTAKLIMVAPLPFARLFST
jgi:hypothetical protein